MIRMTHKRHALCDCTDRFPDGTIRHLCPLPPIDGEEEDGNPEYIAKHRHHALCSSNALRTCEHVRPLDSPHT